jgi:beta-ribofuranosylaminobenzene 5'-phosphate synthase
LKGLGAHGIGQSSWGPTGFAFASDPDHAEFLARRVGADGQSGVDITICNARDHGAEIREEEDVPIP